ncbi:trypsin-like [Hemicordylus capensis]|uniref:trypsin-like n=1 Tax=Hemicordylus capensis TaxID=884348 RepID=UPI00230467A5|nr:trypsin-like [Hemicordylus capensis]
MKFFALFFAAGLLGAASSIEKGHIVGGYICPAHSVPWQVRLGRCGGSLINEWWVISAAHCYAPAETLVARLGKHNLSRYEVTEQNLKVAKVIRHSNYNYKTSENDIMLVKLAQKARINKYVRLIRLPTHCPAPGKKCLVSGWGKTHPYQDIYSNVLKCLQEFIFPNKPCTRYFPYRNDSISFNSKSMLCASSNRIGHSSCSGDSGGPLVCNGLLEGIVSWGYRECGVKDYPSVYTKVCKYISWIRRIISSY